MRLDPDTCYSALLARDRRFDGWFYVGVSSTGIYCRPVCAVRTPQRRNCTFYPSAAAAEQSGYRPCLRCRPELAPGNGVLDLSGRLARAAAELIDHGLPQGGSIDDIARRIGVTPRHLRRIFEAEFGVSPVAYAQTQRLLLAKRLLTDTALPMSAVAHAAGFGSVRRFNHLFVTRYGLQPTRLRQAGTARAEAPSITVALAYRPPYAWAALIDFLARRAVDGMEAVTPDAYHRAVAFGVPGQPVQTGWITVTHTPRRHAVEVTLPQRLAPWIAPILAGVRQLFDLTARPDLIDAHLSEFAAEMPGLRVPGAFDGFEIALRAVVGQQIGLPQARRILARLAERHGTPVPDAPHGLHHVLPGAAALATVDPADLRACGLTGARADTLHTLAEAVAAGRIGLHPLAPVEPTLAALRALPGIGDWTAQAIALRGLAWPNAFPAGDLVLRRQLGLDKPADALDHARRWEPWRAYAAMHLWRRATEGETR